MNQVKTMGESVVASALAGASIGRNVAMDEQAEAHGKYLFTATGPVEEHRARYVQLRDQIEAIRAEQSKKQGILGRIWKSLLAPLDSDELKALIAEMDAIPMETKWTETVCNLVTTVGKNFALDTYLAGSAYTAAWYIGLIGLTGYTTGPAVGDTMASHAGWAEDQNYSQAARPTTAWSAASSGSKALSAALSYSINADTIIKGGFLNSVATKGGTTGTLYSAGLFTGGDRALLNGDTLNVSYTASL